MLTDTHCHLDMLKDLKGALQRAKENQVNFIVTIGIDLKTSRKAVEIAETYNFVWAAVGVHPHEAKTLTDEVYKELEILASHPKVVAIGEIGLDFYRNLSPREIQINAFKRQIKLAQKRGKPIVIHCREAISETWQILVETEGLSCKGVWHCFPGDVSFAEKCIENDFYISISGIVTFPKATKLKQVVKKTPLESLLLETDAPFLAPVPMRGKQNEPAFLHYTAQKVADIKEVSLKQVALKTTENAKKLFNLG
ncbi:putative metal-dependent hydrolase YcfH [Candidatus Methanoperedenaceae archaeon GB37]|nr:putative metal-dependent hydrolase YcfH [Candidatus Methanoperedenaceae archaeon GB37]